MLLRFAFIFFAFLGEENNIDAEPMVLHLNFNSTCSYHSSLNRVSLDSLSLNHCFQQVVFLMVTANIVSRNAKRNVLQSCWEEDGYVS